MNYAAVAQVPAHWRVCEPRRVLFSTPQRQIVDEAHDLLRVSLRHLRLTMSVITVAVGALRQQNADCDQDIAQVLERCASDRLDIEIEKIEALLARLHALRADQS